LSAKRVLDRLIRMAQSPFLKHVITKHFRPFLDREAARAEQQGEQVSAYLTPQANQVFDDLSSRPVHLEQQFLEKLIKQDAVRHLIKMIVIETINRFIKSIKGDGDGLLGKVGKLGIGSGLFSKVGKQIEAHLQSAAASFVQGSLDRVMKTVVATVSSPEMAVHLGKLNKAGYRAILALETTIVWQALLRQPLDDLLAVVPGLLSFNIDRAVVQEAVTAEVKAVLDAEESKTIRQIVNDDQLTAQWRAECVEIGSELLSNFARSPEFQSWLAAADKDKSED
ncbi:MAG: hypothetical protein JRJ19_08860, partial [Deltaproteobacteria bacterium]|nr:hypothetical protein [Deltaproteobacteria bacterium]